MRTLQTCTYIYMYVYIYIYVAFTFCCLVCLPASLRGHATSQFGRGVLAGLALLGLRNDNSPEYMEKQYNIARARPSMMVDDVAGLVCE